MIHRLSLLEISQPVGTFYVGKINSNELIKITKTIRRKDETGIQRELSKKRVKEIAKYCEDPDAAFPTPIILSIKEDDVKSIKKSELVDDIFELVYSDNSDFAEILDGQHRVEGIKEAKDYNFELMVVIMFDLTEEEKAYIFSTINSNQTKVDKSLIYDLFALSKDRSPYKTCHEIARIMNSDKNSPFYQKLKMLGKKGNETAVLSQGTFVTYLSKLITNKPQEDMINIKKGKKLEPNSKFILRKYFNDERDDIILKLLYNYFGAVKEVFQEEWNDSDSYILSKTTGYGALIKAFEDFYHEGMKEKRLTKEFFKEKLTNSRELLYNNNVELTSEYIQSGEQGQNKLAKWFKESLK